MENKNDVLLRVEHLCQYFPMGGGVVNKAVDDVSFDIKKGEVFGLVGESGCGKTTTGRSIIKLYDITSGNVYFKDVRIAAGLQSYRKEMAEIKTKYNALIAETVPSPSVLDGFDVAYLSGLPHRISHARIPLLRIHAAHH